MFIETKEAFFEGFVPLKEVIERKSLVKEAVMESLKKLKEGKEIKEAITGSDLLANLSVTQHYLDRQPAYDIENTNRDVSRIAGVRPVANFKPVKIFKTIEVEDLLEVKMQEDYKATFVKDSYIELAIKKFGRTIPIAWETLISDTLGELNDLQTKLSRAAMRTKMKLIVNAFAENTGFFSSGNANKGTKKLAQGSLEEGITAIMKQKDENGNELDLIPKFLVVPTTLAFAAEKLVNPLLASIGADSMDAAPVRFNLQVIVCPWLDAISTTGWYLFVDPADFQAMTTLSLSGHTGIELLIKESDQRAITGLLTGELGSFQNDTVEWKARMFFNVAMRYFQAGYWSNGTV